MNASMTRRTAGKLLAGSAAAAAIPTVSRSESFDQTKRTGMGLVIYDCNIRRRWMREKDPQFDLFEPLTFLKHCHSLGAGGMQASLGVMKSDEIQSLRDFADKHGLFIDAIVKPPTSNDDLPRFEAEIRTARDVGVQAARTTIIPGRRYERFQKLAEFREFEQRGQQMLERAAPIVEKHRVPFAVENHKDQRIEERIALFKHLDSEFIGTCLDTGNSFALLDGAYEPVEALAPHTFTVHLKDQALREYADGFLLGDIPLGQGSFDMKRMVEIIRKSKPNVRFALELITREPLKVPVLTDQFFETMPTTRGIELARTLRFVRDNPAKELQYVNKLPVAQQLELEDANVLASIRFAESELNL